MVGPHPAALLMMLRSGSCSFLAFAVAERLQQRIAESHFGGSSAPGLCKCFETYQTYMPTSKRYHAASSTLKKTCRMWDQLSMRAGMRLVCPHEPAVEGSRRSIFAGFMPYY